MEVNSVVLVFQIRSEEMYQRSGLGGGMFLNAGGTKSPAVDVIGRKPLPLQ